ncbi:hypothetical protein QTP70_004099 [Hemibagrus guttatus]|uniref:Uncharacterized protein n=1 Tax=Hemibagrus guttatus TaxID=175788 RepID=A0AAE0QD36_9TELE|nr:hypothetical protein QTP70_004099 [Hemibagrus guttatus]KAK3546790.1 hypothetical protein QTP86_002898 [Hemibagrus guttatus]
MLVSCFSFPNRSSHSELSVGCESDDEAEILSRIHVLWLFLEGCQSKSWIRLLSANAKEALRELYGAISELQNAHSDGLFIIAGDFNHDFNLKSVLPKFHQYVQPEE